MIDLFILLRMFVRNISFLFRKFYFLRLCLHSHYMLFKYKFFSINSPQKRYRIVDYFWK